MEEFKQQIKDKTQMLGSSSVRVSNLCKATPSSSTPKWRRCNEFQKYLPLLAAAEIMVLHKGIRASEDQISALQREHADKVRGEADVVNVPASVANGSLVSPGLKKQLELSQKKLKDTTLLFQETDSKYSELGM